MKFEQLRRNLGDFSDQPVDDVQDIINLVEKNIRFMQIYAIKNQKLGDLSEIGPLPRWKKWPHFSLAMDRSPPSSETPSKQTEQGTEPWILEESEAFKDSAGSMEIRLDQRWGGSCDRNKKIKKEGNNGRLKAMEWISFFFI